MKFATILFAGMIFIDSAYAQSPANDVQCLVVSTVVNVEARNEQIRNSAALTAAFYLGRIDERIAPKQLAALVKAQESVAGASTIPIFKACAQRADAADARMKNTVKTFLSKR